MGHNNDFGLPVPDATDAYCDVPVYLGALRDAITPRLASQPIVFLDLAQYMLDASGKAAFDLRSTFSAITGVVVCASAAPPYGGNIMQWVTYSSDLPGTFWVRALNLPPPATPTANGAPLLSLMVWGTPK